MIKRKAIFSTKYYSHLLHPKMIVKVFCIRNDQIFGLAWGWWLALQTRVYICHVCLTQNSNVRPTQKMSALFEQCLLQLCLCCPAGTCIYPTWETFCSIFLKATFLPRSRDKQSLYRFKPIIHQQIAWKAWGCESCSTSTEPYWVFLDPPGSFLVLLSKFYLTLPGLA